jgi:formyltetrahydrofolate deformylase
MSAGETAAAARAVAPSALVGTKPPGFVLTTACPDTTGIVAAVSGFLASRNYSITEAQHFDDPYLRTSFMRAVFHDAAGGALQLAELDRSFEAEVAARFGMHWRFKEAARRCRTVIAVSRQGHCLNSMLHRWSTGTLPIDVVAVVSNHQDLRSLVEWHGVPFHYFPVQDGRKAEQERRVIELFEKVEGELLALARYMQILTPQACGYFQGKAINIHHSFLPGFKGAKAYHQAHERGVKLIGATAHYVTTDLDEGPIIEQEVIRVDHSHSADDLVAAGRDVEAIVLARAVQWHAERRILTNGTRTVVFR